ncbi:hypothetical protein ACFQ14_03715 [Pseudahrensia aquimaris]|uniref:RES domain-containing protein n=1 Tax=Pseudahrensia aquimaris TaxID=744461 RepID=A0ABW3FFE7_9HYPH
MIALKQSLIRRQNWEELCELANSSALSSWATPEPFATAVGPSYSPGSAGSIFYVGKAGGPRISEVGHTLDQLAGAVASTRWMMERRNPSAFWSFADELCSDRSLMAWSNLAKIDTLVSRPPMGREWLQIEDICLKALEDELTSLRPHKSVFTTLGYQQRALEGYLSKAGFKEFSVPDTVRKVKAYRTADGGLAFITRHPQGWASRDRDHAAQFILSV